MAGISAANALSLVVMNSESHDYASGTDPDEVIFHALPDVIGESPVQNGDRMAMTLPASIRTERSSQRAASSWALPFSRRT